MSLNPGPIVMHGLINTSIQTFLIGNYGTAVWLDVATEIGIPPEGYEAMLTYDHSHTDALLAAASTRLNKPRLGFLEDLGAYVAMIEPVRRLLRFSGPDYPEFLLSLNEMQGRAQMALPDLEMPELTCSLEHVGVYRLSVHSKMLGWGAAMTGLVRAMADDYGALAFIEYLDQVQDRGGVCDDQMVQEDVLVTLLEESFAEGRSFDLAAPAGRV
ncbi:heme NO-binding domain-containing protein [Thioclava sp. GXIMD4216]|uniref:Heme NO-binding domain-containing protein n=1 Tax=Thioclava litoralis TaxID=3076557 RepID=A0ABZ1DYV2_9RHOB|nr:heme NO-binding domain-containing protein [Thioclava sp. FTW29]